jgi:hypothetical protein
MASTSTYSSASSASLAAQLPPQQRLYSIIRTNDVTKTLTVSS